MKSAHFASAVGGLAKRTASVRLTNGCVPNARYPVHQGPRIVDRLHALWKQDDRRDTLNTKSGTKRLFLFRIHLGQTNMWFKNLGCLLICRCHHAAGSAPWRPEIHDQRDIVSDRVHVEIRHRQRDRMSREQQRMTLPHLGPSLRRVSGTRLMPRQW